jgi:hypothetical protein
MKFDRILFGAVVLVSVASTLGQPADEKAKMKDALVKIFTAPGLWGKDYPAALASLPAWNRLGEKSVWVFADRVIGGLPHKTREEAQAEAKRFSEAVKELRPKPVPKFETLLKDKTEQLRAGKMEVIPFFQDDGTARIAWTTGSHQLLAPRLKMATVKERLGPAKKVSTEVIQGQGERRPVILTVHSYADGAVAFAESDVAPRPGFVNRVILDVPVVTAALFEEVR